MPVHDDQTLEFQFDRRFTELETRFAFQEQGALHGERQVQHGGEAVVAHVLVAGQVLLELRDRVDDSHSYERSVCVQGACYCVRRGDRARARPSRTACASVALHQENGKVYEWNCIS